MPDEDNEVTVVCLHDEDSQSTIKMWKILKKKKWKSSVVCYVMVHPSSLPPGRNTPARMGYHLYTSIAVVLRIRTNRVCTCTVILGKRTGRDSVLQIAKQIFSVL